MRGRKAEFVDLYLCMTRGEGREKRRKGEGDPLL